MYQRLKYRSTWKSPYQMKVQNFPQALQEMFKWHFSTALKKALIKLVLPLLVPFYFIMPPSQINCANPWNGKWSNFSFKRPGPVAGVMLTLVKGWLKASGYRHCAWYLLQATSVHHVVIQTVCLDMAILETGYEWQSLIAPEWLKNVVQVFMDL